MIIIIQIFLTLYDNNYYSYSFQWIFVLYIIEDKSKGVLSHKMSKKITHHFFAKSLFVLIFFCAYGFSANIQSLENTDIQSSTLTDKSLLNSPLQVSLITSEELDNKNATSLKEALSNTNGLVIKNSHGGGYEVSMQGIDANRILILIDGQKLINPTGSRVDLSQYDVADIEKIEVIRGALSTLYGSSAMGGVINIITKNSINSSSENKKSIKVKSIIGSFGDFAKSLQSSLSVYGDYQSEGHTISLFGTQRKTPSIKLFPSNPYEDLAGSTFINSGITYKYSDDEAHKYLVHYDYFDEKKSANSANILPNKVIKRVDRQIADRHTFGLHSTHTFSDYGTLEFRLNNKAYFDQSVKDYAKTPQDDEVRTANISIKQIQAHYKLPLIGDHLVNFGIEAFVEGLDQKQGKLQLDDSYDYTSEIAKDAQRENIDMFVQNDYFYSDDLEFVIGTRVQKDSGFGLFNAPKINAFYTIDKSNDRQIDLKVGIGKGYRVPNLKERFFYFDHSSVGYIVIGNESLQPEESLSYQMDFNYIKNEDFHLQAHLFKNDITNLIQTTPNPRIKNGIAQYSYHNVGKAQTQGVGLSLAKDFADFDFTIGYDYIDTKNLENNKRLPLQSNHHLKTHLKYLYNDLSTNIYVAYADGFYTDIANQKKSPYSLTVDLDMAYDISDQSTIIGGVKNLFNQYANTTDENDFRIKQPRYIYLGITYQDNTL